MCLNVWVQLLGYPGSAREGMAGRWPGAAAPACSVPARALVPLTRRWIGGPNVHHLDFEIPSHKSGNTTTNHVPQTFCGRPQCISKAKSANRAPQTFCVQARATSKANGSAHHASLDIPLVVLGAGSRNAAQLCTNDFSAIRVTQGVTFPSPWICKTIANQVATSHYI